MTAADLIFCAVTIGLLLGLMTVVRVLGPRFGWSSELQRKMIHIATGLTALSLPLFFSNPLPVAVLMATAIVIMLAMRHPAVAKRGYAAALHGVKRTSYGEILLALAVAILFFRAGDEPVLFVLPILILTLSDSAAALVGTHYGKTKFTVEEGTKSIEGSVMFFLISWIVSMIALLTLSDIDRVNLIFLSMVIAAFATLVEADSWRGFDNLFVPVGVHLFLASHLASEPLELASVVVLFGCLATGLLVLAPKVGLDDHASRAYAVLIFLIMSVTSPLNLILPLAAIAAHIYARTTVDRRAPFMDLDLIAAASLIGLFWLVAGEWVDLNAINLFNLSFAALAVGLLSITRLPLLPHGLVAAIALGSLVYGLHHVNLKSAQWYDMLWPWILAALALAWFLPRWFDGVFQVHHSLRLTSVALATPLILFSSTLLMASWKT